MRRTLEQTNDWAPPFGYLRPNVITHVWPIATQPDSHVIVRKIVEGDAPNREAKYRFDRAYPSASTFIYDQDAIYDWTRDEDDARDCA